MPLAQAFEDGDLTVEDLVGSEASIREHSKVADACEIIEALLPRDGKWHPANTIQEACGENGIDQRTAQRGKDRLRLEHRRTPTFPGYVEWRWPPTDDALTTTADAVASVASVASANGQNPLLSGSDDTHDTDDNANECRQCVVSAESPRADAETAADGPLDDDESRLAELRSRYVDGGER